MVTPPPYWLTVAFKYRGLRETPGPKATPTLMQWARNFGGFVADFFTDDIQPWCALFANAVHEESALPLSGPPGSAALLRAASFINYGVPLDVPALGAILVFKRPGGHHVGWYTGESLKGFRVYGGNQLDSVRDSWLPQRDCIAIRWPDPSVTPGDRVMLRPGELSTPDRLS